MDLEISFFLRSFDVFPGRSKQLLQLYLQFTISAIEVIEGL